MTALVRACGCCRSYLLPPVLRPRFACAALSTSTTSFEASNVPNRNRFFPPRTASGSSDEFAPRRRTGQGSWRRSQDPSPYENDGGRNLRHTPRVDRGESSSSGQKRWGLPPREWESKSRGSGFGLRDPSAPTLVPRQNRFPKREGQRSASPDGSAFPRFAPRTGGREDRSSPAGEAVVSEMPSDDGAASERLPHVRPGREGREGREDRRSSRSYRALLSQAEGEALLPSRGGKGKGKGKEREPDFMSKERERNKREGMGKKRQETRQEKEVFIPSTVTVGRLAYIFDVKLFNLQTRMMRLGMSEDQRRADYMLTAEEACNIALEYGFNPVVDDERSFDIYPDPDHPRDVQPPRPPVVTIMGHVDHGKTTLLDSLRHTSVASGEAGGITQHIGAFSVPLPTLLPSASEGTITFLDTPGHAAFTAMRARGASVTDIVVLVVAADDGVMPQTKEVIELVKGEGEKVGLVVAINKCDKPGIDVAKAKSALGAEGILLEEDGGDVQSVRVSGLEKTGLDDLVETLATLAEIRDLRARRDGKAEGFVLESRVDKGRGNVATVLVSKGTLKSGSSIVAGTTWARVRQMQDDKGKPLREAPPGTPVSITGWKDLPSAGDQLLEAVNGEDEAKRCVTNRLREVERRKMMSDVEQINVKRAEERKRHDIEAKELEKVKEEGGDVHALLMEREHRPENVDGKKQLLLVIKGDVSGTVEAVVGSLEGIGNKEAGVKIIHTGVGEVSESDIHLAEASGATVIGFSVTCPRPIQTLANTLSVPLHLESVIYRLIDTVRSKVVALLPPVLGSRVTGEAVCQQVFEIKLKGKEVMRVAGCKVGNGVIGKNEGVRVLRGSGRTQVYEGTIETLKHVKKDVIEVRKGTECGISFHGWNDIREGDEVVTFTTFDVPREL